MGLELSRPACAPPARINSRDVPVLIVLLSLLWQPLNLRAQQSAQPGDSLTGTQIVERADANMRGRSNRATLAMTIVRPTWSRTVVLRSWMKGDDYSMILITKPPREKGQVFLTRGNEMWHWVPAINRMIKLPPSMMSQSWMGSDFSNNDLLRESSIVTDYTHELTGIEEMDGRRSYRVRLTPLPDAPVVWSKVLVWISTDDFLQVRTEEYDEGDVLVNVLTFGDVQRMDGRRIPTHMDMVPRDEEGRHKTILEIRSMEFNVDISDDFFSQRNMRRVR